MSGDLIKLAERVERLTGPDPDLGREILLACGYRKTEVGYFLGPLYYWGLPGKSDSFKDDDFRQHDPTRSLDAVVALIGEKLQGWPAEVECGALCDGAGSYSACVIQPGHRGIAGHAATPALALLAATLRALSASTRAVETQDEHTVEVRG